MTAPPRKTACVCRSPTRRATPSRSGCLPTHGSTTLQGRVCPVLQPSSFSESESMRSRSISCSRMPRSGGATGTREEEWEWEREIMPSPPPAPKSIPVIFSYYYCHMPFLLLKYISEIYFSYIYCIFHYCTCNILGKMAYPSPSIGI